MTGGDGCYCSFRGNEWYICGHGSAHAGPLFQSEKQVPRRRPIILAAFVATVVLVTGCAAPTAQVIRTLFDPAAENLRLTNILVISVAGNYAERAQVEQQLAVALTTNQATVSPYYAVMGRSPRITRDLLNTAIRSRQFDGVLIIREQGQDIPNAAPGRPTGNEFQLFLYDYDEFNQPTRLSANSTITLVSEFYTTWNEKKIWSINTLTFDFDTVAEAIELQASTIEAQVRRDRIVAN